MQQSRSSLKSGLLIFGLSLLAMGTITQSATAHEKWFIDAKPFPLRWDLFFSTETLAYVGAVVAVFLILVIIERRRSHDFLPQPETFGATPATKRTLYALLPLIIGIHVAISLIYGGTHGQLLSPNNELHGAPAYLCGIVEIWIALSFFYGGLTRVAAVTLFLLWVIGFLTIGQQSMFDNLLVPGIACFFFMAGRGPIAVDRLMFPRLEPSERLMRHAMAALRMGLGASFIVVACTEKLANFPLAEAFLHQYSVNFTPFFGVPMSDHSFILAAGSIELLVGLCLLFGVFTREIILIAWLPINISLTFFNVTELVGHLPIYGIMACLLIWIPNKKEEQAWVEALSGPLSDPNNGLVAPTST